MCIMIMRHSIPDIVYVGVVIVVSSFVTKRRYGEA